MSTTLIAAIKTALTRNGYSVGKTVQMGDGYYDGGVTRVFVSYVKKGKFEAEGYVDVKDGAILDEAKHINRTAVRSIVTSAAA